MFRGELRSAKCPFCQGQGEETFPLGRHCHWFECSFCRGIFSRTLDELEAEEAERVGFENLTTLGQLVKRLYDS